jgi:predicted transport protein
MGENNGEVGDDEDDSENDSEEIIKDYNKEYYISRRYDEEVAHNFFDVVNKIDEIIKNNGWKLEKKLNKRYIAFKLGKRQVFCISWYSKKKFGIWFKIKPEDLDKFGKVCPYEFTDHDNDWGGTGVDYNNEIDISRMEKTFEFVYKLFSEIEK